MKTTKKLYKITAKREDIYLDCQITPNLCVFRYANDEEEIHRLINHHGFKMKESYKDLKIEEVQK